MKTENERPKASRKREPFFILTVVAAVVAGLLLLDTAVPLLPREAITSLFTGGKGDNTNPSGEVVTRPLSLWEQIFGGVDRWEPDEPDGPDESDPPGDWLWNETEAPVEDRPWLWDTEVPVEDIPVTDIELPVAVSYISQSTVRTWKKQIVKAMEVLARQYQKQGIDTLQLGLFDFGPDGTPEIVVTTYDVPNERYPMYELMVYDLSGNPLFAMGNGDLSQFFVYAQRGQTYPCITAYFNIYEANERYSEEQMIRVYDGGGKCSVLYGVTKVGERYSYASDDRQTDKDGWYGAMEAFEMQYEALGETEMLWFGWPFGMDAEEIAELMVSSDQRFVQPILEADAYGYAK